MPDFSPSRLKAIQHSLSEIINRHRLWERQGGLRSDPYPDTTTHVTGFMEEQLDRIAHALECIAKSMDPDFKTLDLVQEDFRNQFRQVEQVAEWIKSKHQS